MTTMPKEWSRQYMRERRAGEPPRVRDREKESLDRSDSWPGPGHCRRCFLQTEEPEICITCWWEMGIRK